MKKIIFSGVIIVSLLVLTGFALAAKPAGNFAEAITYGWNLSGDVMPVPPYGLSDILGSDTASKLIVNQPNGKVLANMTGVMNGLNPNTEYTVYLSNVYTSYVFTGWNVAGNWEINVEYLGINYPETLVLNQSGTGITGVSLDTIPPGSFFTVTGGSVIGDVINIFANNGSYFVHMLGTIASDGSISGSWADVQARGTRIGTWASTKGQAVKNYNGTAGWPGLLTPTVQPFTFTTDSSGSGSWHVNLTGVNIALPTSFSVWINGGGGTILVSDPVFLK